MTPDQIEVAQRKGNARTEKEISGFKIEEKICPWGKRSLPVIEE